MSISQYDTIKDKHNTRYRVIEVNTGANACKAQKLRDMGQGMKATGRPRIISLDDIGPGKKYTRVNLGPVTVYYNRKIDEMSEEVSKMAQDTTQVVKTVQNVNESLTGVSDDEYIDSPECEMMDKEIQALEVENKKLRATVVELRGINEAWASGQRERDFEVLRAECKDKVQECIDLKKTIDAMTTEHKKTISKMKQEHEEEVRALKDELMEAQALGRKVGEYAGRLDEDSDAFEEILTLAGIISSAAVQMRRASGLIMAKTEGRV